MYLLRETMNALLVTHPVISQAFQSSYDPLPALRWEPGETANCLQLGSAKATYVGQELDRVASLKGTATLNVNYTGKRERSSCKIPGFGRRA